MQGTFDDLSEEEKTKAYLQFLQYHQQLEKESGTKRFQEMLNKGIEANSDDGQDSQNLNKDEESLKVWYGISSDISIRANIWTISTLMAVVYVMRAFLLL